MCMSFLERSGSRLSENVYRGTTCDECRSRAESAREAESMPTLYSVAVEGATSNVGRFGPLRPQLGGGLHARLCTSGLSLTQLSVAWNLLEGCC